jgi:hypothetical protein
MRCEFAPAFIGRLRTVRHHKVCGGLLRGWRRWRVLAKRIGLVSRLPDNSQHPVTLLRPDAGSPATSPVRWTASFEPDLRKPDVE